jgi:ATP-dependent DNA helicase DinG
MWGDEETIPSPQQYIDAVFGRDGYLAKRWGSGYQPREGQIVLARAVDRALRERTHLLSEAATGVGKSVAYSVPATYHAAMEGKVVIIVTANIALQEQLVKRDLPLLGEILPWGFSFGLMKGRANYLCRSQYEKVRLNSRQQLMQFGANDNVAPSPERDRARLLEWAAIEVTSRLRGVGGYGDKSTLDWSPADKIWREFSVDREDCRGSRCEFASSCGALAAQQYAKESQIVVTNYHIFFLNLMLCMERGVDVLLPRFDTAIFDEAHKAADIARDFFGWRISEGSVRRAVRHFRSIDPILVETVQRAGGRFFEQMLQLRRDRDRYKARIVMNRLNQYDVDAIRALLDRLVEVTARLSQEMEFHGDPHGAIELEVNRARHLHAQVASLLDGEVDNAVFFVEEDEFRKAHVACRLIRPAQLLRGGLFGKTVVHPSEGGVDPVSEPVSIVCTSATLVTESGFEFTASELGAPRGCEQLVVGSPFDFGSQALLIIPNVCDPNDFAFTSEVAAALLRTIVLARGRTLGLFTSRKRMHDVFDAIVGKTPFRILKQDDGQRTWLIDEFRRDTHSVLLGVASFWAGVDVPGESLSVVFIDKIPFPTPDDPVLDKLMENDRRAWAGYAVPRAIIEFKQGFGRLIRSTTDRGVVVCCDTRLITKGYGKQFLRAMPRDMQKVRNLEAIREWLDGPRAEAEEVDPLS